jgi:hypothetical protein
MRGLLSEYGVIIPKRLGVLRLEVPIVLEDVANTLSVPAKQFIADLYLS